MCLIFQEYPYFCKLNTETQLQFNGNTLGVSLQNFSRKLLLSFEMCLIFQECP